MAAVLIIGASRGIGLETVKAARRGGHPARPFAGSLRPRSGQPDRPQLNPHLDADPAHFRRRHLESLPAAGATRGACADASFRRHPRTAQYHRPRSPAHPLGADKGVLKKIAEPAIRLSFVPP